MKISVFYEHIEKACEQTKKPLREVLEYVKACGIDGVEMDYDELAHDSLEKFTGRRVSDQQHIWFLPFRH